MIIWKYEVDALLQITLFILFTLLFRKFCFGNGINRKRNMLMTKSISSPRISTVPSKMRYPYAIYEIMGGRPYMEDRFSAYGSLRGVFEHSLYAIFDGHGGSCASEFCAKNICKILTKEVSYTLNPVKALKSAFLHIDEQFLHMARQRHMDDGTTAIVMLVQDEKIYVANAGDSRAIIARRNGDVIALSDDHKPNRPDEVMRIEKAGGSVLFRGTWRVEGVLAVSRAIGDRPLKPYVTALPDVVTRNLDTDDIAAVIASDGLWDVMDNNEVASMLLACIKNNSSMHLCAQNLVAEAFRRGSNDNISVMVIDFRTKNEPPASDERESHQDKKNN